MCWFLFCDVVQVNIICGNCVDGRCKGVSECPPSFFCFLRDETLETVLKSWKSIKSSFFFILTSGGLGCICSVTQDSTCRYVSLSLLLFISDVTRIIIHHFLINGCMFLLFFHWSRVTVELAIPCEKPGPRVFKGFTVGLHPRSWELVRTEPTQIFW